MGSLLLAGCALTSAPANAQEASLVAVNREAAVGASGLHKAYKEYFPKFIPGYDREQGWTGGVGGRASWMGDVGPVRRAYASVQFTYVSGGVDYVGSKLGTNDPLSFTSGLVTKEARAEIGRGYLVAPRLLLTPVLQAGYHEWNRHLAVDQVEDYRDLRLGLAVKADYALTSRLVGRARLGLAETVAPEITVDYGGTNTVGLGDRPVYQASIGLDYACTRRLSVFGDLDFQHYGYGRSDTFQTTRGRLFEPTSRTDDLLLTAGLAYRF